MNTTNKLENQLVKKSNRLNNYLNYRLNSSIAIINSTYESFLSSEEDQNDDD